MLLMLIEELSLYDIECFYANTDGASFMCPEEKQDILKSVCKNWEDKLKMELEFTDFKECYIRDSNAYVIVKPDGKTKLKGPYEYQGYIEKYGEFDLTGSFDMPIISYAAAMYFINKTPVEKTITEHISLYPFDGAYDYCTSRKTGSQFHNLLVTGDDVNYKLEKVQQSIRYFVSKSNQKIYKVKEKTEKEIIKLVEDYKKGNKNLINTYVVSSKKTNDSKYVLIREINGKYVYVIESLQSQKTFKKEWMSYTDVEVGRNVSLFNDYRELKEFEIDFDYYISEAKKLVDAIESKKVIKKKEKVKSLF